MSIHQGKNSSSGYLRKETAVVSIVLPFVYSGLAHFAVHLKHSHQKKEEILRWKKKKEITVKSEIKDAPNYKPPPITSRTKLPNLYNIRRPRL